jgi:hypothetical protein
MNISGIFNIYISYIFHIFYPVEEDITLEAQRFVVDAVENVVD